MLPVTQIQRFCVHDGPGIRTTVFLKGCPLRCAWCHNPETQEPTLQILYTQALCLGCGACAAVCPGKAHRFENGTHSFDVTCCRGCGACAEVCPCGAIEAAGQPMEVEALVAEVEKDRAFYGTEGGLTLSGGEPLLHGAEALHLLQAVQDAGISTAVETCGYFDSKWIPELVKRADWLLWDFKDSNPERHRQYTGVRPEKIWENLYRADAQGARIRLRCLLVHGVNTETAHYQAIASVFHRLTHVESVELLAYHAMGGSKKKRLGYEDNGRKEWIPTAEEMENAKKFLTENGVIVYNN